MTDAQFAENFNVSTKTISRALDKLEEINLITRKTVTLSSRRVRTLSSRQNDCLKMKQTICPCETDNLSNSNGQNDFIKDNIKDKRKDNSSTFVDVWGVAPNP